MPWPSKKNSPAVVRALLPLGRRTTAQIFRLVDNSSPAFLWEGPGCSETDQRCSYIGIRPRKIISIHQDQVNIRNPRGLRSSSLLERGNDPFAVLASELEIFPVNQNGFAHTLPPAVGFVSYDTARYFEKIKGLRAHLYEPDVYFLVPKILLALNHQEDHIQVFYWPVEERRDEEEISTLCQKLQAPYDNQDGNLSFYAKLSREYNIPYRTRFSKETFVSLVKRAKEYIRAGDIFQVVLANTLTVDRSFDPLRLYEALRFLNPSPYHFFLRFGQYTFVGASPETMLQSTSSPHQFADQCARNFRMRLVAGTYPHLPFADKNQTFRQQLALDEKERAEHIMLVDHARNDIGRVAKIGSVRVDDLLSVESYSNVHHLVSQVSGELGKGETMLTALRSCFPICTLTGTPKIRAMQIISELEGPSRGIFGGAVAMFSGSDKIDSAVAIRGLVVGSCETTLSVGAGIVHDSVPEREYEECLWKARASLQAIEAAVKRRA